MKILPVALLTSLLGVASGFAGSFGPPPFTGGSPLQTGVDGTYQGTLSGTNLSGILKFAYQSGSQSGLATQNTWMAFSEGSIYRGSLSTVISDGDIQGILDSDSLSIPTGDDGTVVLPLIFIVRGSRAAGSFHAKLDLQSPTGEFNGGGSMEGTISEEVTFVTLSSNPYGALFDYGYEYQYDTNGNLTNVIETSGDNNQGSVLVSTSSVVLPSGDLPYVKFSVRGTRTSTSVTGGASNSTGSTN